VEKPFMLMDSVWLRREISPEDYFLEAASIVDTVFKHKGLLCLNWHSNLINAIEMKSFRYVYFSIVEYIYKRLKQEG